MNGRTLFTLTAAALTVLAVTACSSSGSPMATAASSSAGNTATAKVGDLTITGGYIPQQASPDVAAAYLTITNSGARADTLSKVTTNVTSDVMAMNETDHGASGAMTDLPKVVIPAHGSFHFTQAHAHLMLHKPSHLLTQGQHVSMTITFTHAGTVHLVLPVVGFTGPSDDMSSMDMSGDN